MAGRNQHYIPRFLLRAFEIPRSRREIWYHGRDKAAERRPTKRTASGDSFYSEPTFEGRKTLDDAITGIESGLAVSLNEIRRLPPGSMVAPSTAAAIVSHLAQRTAHMRATLNEGVARLLERAEEVFAERDVVESLMGLDDRVPTARFRDAAMNELAKNPEIARRGIPPRVLERTAFLLAKENSGKLAELASVLLVGLRPRMSGLVRDSHNKALGGAVGSSDYEAFLQTFEWSVEAAPAAGAILPDCVVIAAGPEGRAGNHLLIGRDALQALVLAVSPEKLLVGCKPESALPSDFDYNVEATCLSHSFFLSPRKDEETERLQTTIG